MPDNTPRDPKGGDEIWMGRIGVTAGMEIFTNQTAAEKWLLAAPKQRRVWKAVLSGAREYVLSPPVPSRLVPKEES